MTTKSKLLFLVSDKFGPLYYHNVYAFYDEPITFTALNEFGQLYFCYSLGLDDSNKYDQWLIVPISEERANKLEQKDIPILKAIQQTKESKVLFVKIDIESNECIESMENTKNTSYILPTSEVYICENINYDGKRKHTHRIRIAKENNTPIVSGVLDNASTYFGNFCKTYLRKFDISTNFFPQDAIRGSFVYRVKAESVSELYSKGHSILNNIADKQEFLLALDNREIDLRVVRKLFDLLLSNKLVIQLIDENSTETILELSSDYVKELLKEVDNRLSDYLDSSMVPQADNLDRIKSYLYIYNTEGFVTAKALGVEERQVGYYRGACLNLSLIHNYAKLTPLGMKALIAKDEQEYIQIIQRQFEETECGNIWMLKEGVTSIVDINEGSATKFLIENCNGLSPKTSARRAQTLKAWVRKFKEFT